jgi:hypothetical protein
VDGEVICTTGEHPFWVPDKGWVEARDLQVGSLLQTEDGKIIGLFRTYFVKLTRKMPSQKSSYFKIMEVSKSIPSSFYYF